MYILYERKYDREEQDVGGNLIKPMPHTMFNVTAYDLFLSVILSLLEDILNITFIMN